MITRAASELLAHIAATVPVVALDLEMTGLDPGYDEIIEVAVIRNEGGLNRHFSTLIRPAVPISPAAQRITGLRAADFESAPSFSAIADELRRWLDGAVIIAHNVPHDLAFLHRAFDRVGAPLPPPTTIDTLLLARRLFAFPKNNLATVADRLGVPATTAHRALGDATTTLAVWRRMLNILDPSDSVTVAELQDLIGALAPNSPLRIRQQHALKEAFRQHKTLFIEYAVTDTSQVGIVRREIGIWRLRLPYIQAWCYLRDGERVFRLDRIRAIADAGRPYEVPPHEPKI